jgi:ABC-type glycerol-3-phosphate transport system permease component
MPAASARVPYRHSGKVFGAVIITLMIPSALTFIPSFIIVSELGWVSSVSRTLCVPVVSRLFGRGVAVCGCRPVVRTSG